MSVDRRPAPVLPDGLHYAKTTPDAEGWHVANGSGRRICDGGPSTARGVRRPTNLGDVDAACLAALNGGIYRALRHV